MTEPRHLHPAGMLIAAQATVRSWVSALAFPIIAALFNRGWGLGALLFIVGAGALLIVSAVWGFLSWRATTYEVVNGAFVLRRGVVQKSERAIPLEHIQSVDVVQGLLQRVFRVYEVRIETAGGGAAGSKRSSSDAALPALSRSAADVLQRELAARGSMPAATQPARTLEVIRRVTARELLIAGATSGQIGVALPVIYAGWQLFDNFVSEDRVQRFIESVLPHTLGAILIVAGVALVLSWLLAIAGTFIAYTGFTLYRDGDNLRIQRGLLTRNDVTIPVHRIQAIRAVEGLLRQPFGLALVRMDSAGYGEDAGVSTTLFPLLARRELQAFLRAAAPEFAVELELQPLPRRALRRYILRELRPWLLLLVPLLLVALLANVEYPSSLRLPALGAYVVILIVAAVYGWLQYGGSGWSYVGDCLVLASRRLARVTVIAPRRQLQSRSVIQNPFQRRARLATLAVRVATGGGGTSVQLLDMDADTALLTARMLGPRKRPVAADGQAPDAG
ncbi:MAG: PH domain-containing protein [Chloroflexota bacterium]|nr:PH domain-containing protein [Chloroflexota bacterium]